MPEKTIAETNVPPDVPESDPLPAGTPASTNPPQPIPPAGMSRASAPVMEAPRAQEAGTPLAGEKRPAVTQVKRAPQPVLDPKAWFLVAAVLALLAVLVFIVTPGRKKSGGGDQPAAAQEIQAGQELSNYSEFVAKSKALKEKPYSEKELSDEPYSGKAPLAVREGGPLLSAELDPQLAALANALKIRVEIIHRSQVVARGRSGARITKGDYRGFRVNALERLENGAVVSREVSVITPQGGLFKTVDSVLWEVKKTDYSRIVAEIQNAGMEFSVGPVPAGSKTAIGRLRSVRTWGKPIAGELLISGKSVGSVMLGMPVTQIRKRLPASHGVLKRKVLVNDAYYDVYKITNQEQEPLFYVYERDGQVWGISVISEAFKTDKGIGIGSSLDLIRLHYPVVKLAQAEKKPPFLRLEGVDGMFIIQAEGEKKVISILIGESPEFE